jgi:hypothetical protein
MNTRREDFKHNGVVYSVDTSVDVSGVISQEIKLGHEVLWHGIIKTQDEHVKRCLIELGWTPPKEVV